MKPDQQAARDFARRLCELMRARGLVSDTSRSGVDVVALAEASGTSSESASRSCASSAAGR